MTLRRLLCLLAGLGLLPAAAAGAARPGPTSPVVEAAAAAGLRPEVLRLALRAHARAQAAGLTNSPVLTVIDYSLPSRVRRLWVLDVRGGRVLARELVAHGRNSGDDVPHRFSNRAGSLQSSLGLFLTGRVYRGKHGLSLRLRGLDPRLNGRAEERAIVVHGADYVSQRTIAALGRLGRSQGCPALDRAVARRVIELIRGGTALFAYHPSAARESRLAAR
jgi:hypothetical protein